MFRGGRKRGTHTHTHHWRCTVKFRVILLRFASKTTAEVFTKDFSSNRIDWLTWSTFFPFETFSAKIHCLLERCNFLMLCTFDEMCANEWVRTRNDIYFFNGKTEFPSSSPVTACRCEWCRLFKLVRMCLPKQIYCNEHLNDFIVSMRIELIKLRNAGGECGP